VCIEEPRPFCKLCWIAPNFAWFYSTKILDQQWCDKPDFSLWGVSRHPKVSTNGRKSKSYSLLAKEMQLPKPAESVPNTQLAAMLVIPSFWHPITTQQYHLIVKGI